MQRTSKEAYKRLKKVGAESSKGLCIFALSKFKDLTYRELEEKTGLDINRICGAMYTLRGCDKGDRYPKDKEGNSVVMVSKKRFCEVRQNEVIAWKLNPGFRKLVEIIK